MDLKIKTTLICLFLLLIGNLSSVEAQVLDTCEFEVDSVLPTDVNQSFFKSKSTWGVIIPSAMITYGLISLESDVLKRWDYSIRDKLLEDNSTWNSSWDDYMLFTPAVTAFGLKLAGVESKHKLSDMAILYSLSYVLEKAIVNTTKHFSNRERPDKSNLYSFPSGHTASAFVSAEFLHQEYKDKSVWISIGGYGMATLIGVSRVYNNKHWLSDVVAGAGIGILTTKVVYWTYPYLQNMFSRKNNKYNTFVCPTYNNGELGFNLSCTF